MANHGALYDNFTRQAQHGHGSSQYDEGFGRPTPAGNHGQLHDDFGKPTSRTLHGGRFDDFGWTALPSMHGRHFDQDFDRTTAHDGDHGTWFDVFRGGTEVRAMVEGADYEGTIIDVNADYANVRGHDGQVREVGLSQFLAFRSPSTTGTGPSIPESTAHAPSAHDPVAHGAFGEDRGPALASEPGVIGHVHPGEHSEPRQVGVPDGLMDTFTHLKSLAADLDVAKDIDTTETALQTQGGAAAKTVGHRANCPRGGSDPCGADVKGSCTLCGAKVKDHEAVGKSGTDRMAGAATVTILPGGGTRGQDDRQATGYPTGPEVPKREHASTDHHSSQQLPGRCPHCGKALALNDERTEMGQPRRSTKQGGASAWSTTTAHKCSGTGLDVLKSLLEV